MIRVVVKSIDSKHDWSYMAFNYVLEVSSFVSSIDRSYSGLEIRCVNELGGIDKHRFCKDVIVSSVQWIEDDCDDDF